MGIYKFPIFLGKDLPPRAFLSQTSFSISAIGQNETYQDSFGQIVILTNIWPVLRVSSLSPDFPSFLLLFLPSFFIYLSPTMCWSLP